MAKTGRSSKPCTLLSVTVALITTALMIASLMLIYTIVFNDNLFSLDKVQGKLHQLQSRSFVGSPSLTRTLEDLRQKMVPVGPVKSAASHQDSEANVPSQWVPIDIVVTEDPTITLCKLNFDKYYREPHLYAMFRDFVAMSDCSGENVRRERLSILKAEANAKISSGELHQVEPSGFVFHESRVGSTLVANLLGADPHSMVFSESGPPVDVLLHCTRCPKEQTLSMFRDIVHLMTLSSVHTRAFFKFQSITTTAMELALEAFPNVPWIFVYREPVQVVMSHLDPSKGSSGAPCLRSKASPPEKLQVILKSEGGVANPKEATKEAHCTAHLAMLCDYAISAHNKHGYYPDGSPRGLLLNYDMLPGAIPQFALPLLFHISPSSNWLRSMDEEQAFYSKGHGKTTEFTSDTEHKESIASSDVRAATDVLLKPRFDEMNVISHKSLIKLFDVNGVNDVNMRDALLDPKIVSIVGSFFVIDKSSSSSSSSSNRGLVENLHTFHKTDLLSPYDPFTSRVESIPVDRIECPDVPSSQYPTVYNLVDMITNWPVDDTNIPPTHHDSFCHIDYQKDFEKAIRYRDAEVPFIVFNVPQLEATVDNWLDEDYISDKLKQKSYRTEVSESNHFMYWSGSANKAYPDWKPPTSVTQQTFDQWIRNAVSDHNKTLEDREHFYFRVSTGTPDAEWIFEDLPFFQPVESLFMKDPHGQRGIHCRFGMRSVIAEAHWDGSRNMVAELRGLRRWILLPPKQCENLYLLPKSHPSGRHSAVSWSDPDFKQHPLFAQAQAMEVILRPGDVLYVPTYWLHFIVSLTVNAQCNTRSGTYLGDKGDLANCGW